MQEEKAMIFLLNARPEVVCFRLKFCWKKIEHILAERKTLEKRAKLK